MGGEFHAPVCVFLAPRWTGWEFKRIPCFTCLGCRGTPPPPGLCRAQDSFDWVLCRAREEVGVCFFGSCLKAGECFKKHCQYFQLMSKLLIHSSPPTAQCRSFYTAASNRLRFFGGRWRIYPVCVRPTAIYSGKIYCYLYVRTYLDGVGEGWYGCRSLDPHQSPAAQGGASGVLIKRSKTVKGFCCRERSFLVFSRTRYSKGSCCLYTRRRVDKCVFCTYGKKWLLRALLRDPPWQCKQPLFFWRGGG